MSAPEATYILVCLAFAVTFGCVWPWAFCVLVALGGMKHRTWRRVLYAGLLGPFALGDVLAHRGDWRA
jgi:hypothetical protein